MDRGDREADGSARRDDEVGTTVVGARAPRRLDRAHVAAIIQQVPHEAYSLAMHRPDPTTGAMRWRRGLITDVDGHDVLAAIDAGRICLRLDDIAEFADRFDIPLPAGPVPVPPGRRLRHGLIVASPGLVFSLPPAAGPGALRVLEGSAGLLAAQSAGHGRHRETVATAARGEDLVWRPGPSPTIASGDETLLALTFDPMGATGRTGWAGVADAIRRAPAALLAGLRPPGGAATPGGRADFRLARVRATPRSAP